MSSSSVTLPVIAGLAVGIGFVLVFSIFMNVSKLQEPTPAVSVSTSHQQQQEMLERGNIAMGFDQDKIMHHFMSTSTGGQIMIVALDSSGEETINQIKAHVADIQREFSQGNFTKPFFIHDQQVPGTDVMEAKKDLIKYSIKSLNNGSTLVLTTDDGELLQAIHQFMEYQGKEHQGH